MVLIKNRERRFLDIATEGNKVEGRTALVSGVERARDLHVSLHFACFEFVEVFKLDDEYLIAGGAFFGSWCLVCDEDRIFLLQPSAPDLRLRSSIDHFNALARRENHFIAIFLERIVSKINAWLILFVFLT